MPQVVTIHKIHITLNQDNPTDQALWQRIRHEFEAAPPPVPVNPQPPASSFPAIPATAVEVFDDSLELFPLGTVNDPSIPALPGELWTSGSQPNALVEIVLDETGQPVLQDSIWDVNKLGQTGARAFFAGRSWNRFAAHYGKEAWLTYDTRILKFIPIEQGAGNFCCLGAEGKNGAQGIWALNAEVIDGKMIPWLQMQSNPAGVVLPPVLDPLPINVWYPTQVNMLLTGDKTKGWMKWYVGKNVIEAKNCATMALNKSMGIALCLYAGEGKGVILNNDKYAVQFRNVKLRVAA